MLILESQVLILYPPENCPRIWRHRAVPLRGVLESVASWPFPWLDTLRWPSSSWLGSASASTSCSCASWSFRFSGTSAGSSLACRPWARSGGCTTRWAGNGEEGRTVKEWFGHSTWLKLLESTASKMAEDLASSRPWASLYTNCNTFSSVQFSRSVVSNSL